MMIIIIIIIINTKKKSRCPRGVMVKAMDCRIVVREFDTPAALLHSLSDKYP